MDMVCNVIVLLYCSLKKDNILQPVHNRASMEEICAYYMDYVARQGLTQYFNNYSTVTSVERVLDVCHTVDDESGEQNPCSRDHSDKVKWEVRGYQVITDDLGQEETVNFCLRAPNVVLATGAFDTPNKLGVSGENLPYVLHSVVELEAVIKAGQLTVESDPVMIIGAGLSAADAVLLTQDLNIPVVHIFRRDVNDPKIILHQLPAMLYPEYHYVLKKMQESGKHEGYDVHAQHEVVQCLEDGKVVVRGRLTGCDSLVKVSYIIVLVGSRPDLSFLPQDGKNLGIIPGLSIDAKNNPIDVDLISYQSVHESGLFALGPLVGDNFVRFLRGGALAIASHLWRKRKGML
jgi:thioredoxin reductase